MGWLLSINKAIQYMDQNMTNKISVETVSLQVFASTAHFQRIFNLGRFSAIDGFVSLDKSCVLPITE